jgi:hypothetical protein
MSMSLEKTVVQVLQDLGFPGDEVHWDGLRAMAKLTALKLAPDGSFHLGHWWRGPLLYALVSKLKPRSVLEFGTGRGYGCFSMAKAAVDQGFPCDIWSVDLLPQDRPQEWAIDDGGGPEVRQLTRAEVWTRHFPAEIRARIHCLTGSSQDVLGSWKQRKLPRVDFCFIDGGHDYRTVKLDFLSALKVANAGCSFLFDDYTARRSFGVTRVLDVEVAKRIPAGAMTTIDMLTMDRTKYGECVEHKMALLPGSVVSADPLRQFYSPAHARIFSIRYRLYQRARRVRALVRTSVGV